MAEYQSWRQQVLGQQTLRTIDVAHDGRHQRGALSQPGFELRPLLGIDQEWQQVQRPGPLAQSVFAVDVVGNAVFANLALDGRASARHVPEAADTEMPEELAPTRTQRAIGGAQLIVVTGLRRRGEVRHQPCDIVVWI